MTSAARKRLHDLNSGKVSLDELVGKIHRNDTVAATAVLRFLAIHAGSRKLNASEASVVSRILIRCSFEKNVLKYFRPRKNSPLIRTSVLALMYHYFYKQGLRDTESKSGRPNIYVAMARAIDARSEDAALTLAANIKKRLQRSKRRNKHHRLPGNYDFGPDDQTAAEGGLLSGGQF